jgi:hypothetical protein
MLWPITKPPAQTMAAAPVAIPTSFRVPGAGTTQGPTRRTTTTVESAPANVAIPASSDCPMNAGRRPGGGAIREFPARMPPDHAARKPTASHGTTLASFPGCVGTWKAYPSKPPKVTKRPSIIESWAFRRRESNSSGEGEAPGGSVGWLVTGEAAAAIDGNWGTAS